KGNIYKRGTHKRKRSQDLANPPLPPEPDIVEIVLIDEIDIAIIRTNEKSKGNAVGWWRYQVSTGDYLGRVVPEGIDIPDSDLKIELWSQRLPNAPLIATHWYVVTHDSGRPSGSAWLTIHDIEGELVWDKLYAEEYNTPDGIVHWYYDIAVQDRKQFNADNTTFSFESYDKEVVDIFKWQENIDGWSILKIE